MEQQEDVRCPICGGPAGRGWGGICDSCERNSEE